MKAPRPIFVKLLLPFILIAVGTFVLPWLNLPSYTLWIFVAVYAVYVFIVIVFGRHSSDVKS